MQEIINHWNRKYDTFLLLLLPNTIGGETEKDEKEPDQTNKQTKNHLLAKFRKMDAIDKLCT